MSGKYQLSSAGAQFIGEREGLRTSAYKDEAGIWTIGYGHTQGVREGMVITKEQAVQMKKEASAEFVRGVNRMLKVDVSQEQFDALVSLSYNIGTRALANSTLMKKLNEGDYEGAAEQFKVFNKLKDEKTGQYRESAGLSKRRAMETEMFLGRKDGDFDDSDVEIGYEVLPPEMGEKMVQTNSEILNGLKTLSSNLGMQPTDYDRFKSAAEGNQVALEAVRREGRGY